MNDRSVEESGLIGAPASDLVRIPEIALGTYRKAKLGRSAPITIKNHGNA